MASEVPARPRLRFEASAQDDRHKTIGHNLRQPASARSTYYGVRRLFTLGACDQSARKMEQANRSAKSDG